MTWKFKMCGSASEVAAVLNGLPPSEAQLAKVVSSFAIGTFFVFYPEGA